MTMSTHERASDRTAEALLNVEKLRGECFDYVVMIQGDEPMVVPEMIDESIRPILTEPSTYVVNLMAPLKSKEEQEDPHEIKVVTDRDGFALYFSRLPIPYNR